MNEVEQLRKDTREALKREKMEIDIMKAKWDIEQIKYERAQLLKEKKKILRALK